MSKATENTETAVEKVIEPKDVKFRRLAVGRTRNAIKQLQGLGKLGTSAYVYTPEQVKAIFDAIAKEAETAYNKLMKVKSAVGNQFDL